MEHSRTWHRDQAAICQGQSSGLTKVSELRKLGHIHSVPHRVSAWWPGDDRLVAEAELPVGACGVPGQASGENKCGNSTKS